MINDYKQIGILGARWTIEERRAQDDKRLDTCDGYCDWSTRLIVVEREAEGTLGDMDRYVRKVLRHEIVHAFLLECGLAESTYPAEAWAHNEEMVDWFARMGPRIWAAWLAAGAVLPVDGGEKEAGE